MGLTDLLTANKGSTISLDTMLFIYLFEENDIYLDQVRTIFKYIEKGEVKAVTSSITVIECLTKPLREKKFSIAAKYGASLRNFPNLKVEPVSIKIAEKAANIRANYGLKTPDSVQIAAGIVNKSKIFFTNDFKLKKIDDIEIVQLSDL